MCYQTQKSVKCVLHLRENMFIMVPSRAFPVELFSGALFKHPSHVHMYVDEKEIVQFLQTQEKAVKNVGLNSV